ncbi:DUF58 domain-containing protein [Psychromicrobium lacuslunae]|uniref:DUF58 domain-containing protein n=1 Tax=Psychromicrobium lacuslunae TaxID=1618207 RepID=A0A0D4BWC7_9MICC|nr:DUF58 domain-containing protein [Psychromicrobium lacuslunae]AJT40431.1 hypothetical protein UM93_00655 [Psychromicrobium lacuslunae]
MNFTGVRFLTTRGWGMLGAGFFAILLAQIMGRKDLLTLGLFLVLLPLLAALGIRFVAPRFSVHREFSPAVLETGMTTTVDLAVGGSSKLGSRVKMREALPQSFGRSPEFSYPGRVQTTLDVGVQGSRYQYHLRSNHRGQYSIGPVSAQLGDAFGLSQHLQSLHGTDTLTVTPRAIELPFNRLSGARGTDGSSATRQQANPSDDDVMTREYRHGDPMRRVHWPATARHGQLMVRQEESVTTPEAVLLIDQRSSSFEQNSASPHRRAESEANLRSSNRFEWAVIAIMSIATHLIEHNYDLRLLDIFARPGLSTSRSSPEPMTEEYAGNAGLASIAEALAAIELEETSNLTPFNEKLFDRLSLSRQRGPLIAFLGDISVSEALSLAAAAEGNTAALAIISTAQPSRAEEAAAVLRRGGWQVAVSDADSSLAEVWRNFDSEPADEPGLQDSSRAGQR